MQESVIASGGEHADAQMRTSSTAWLPPRFGSWCQTILTI